MKYSLFHFVFVITVFVTTDISAENTHASSQSAPSDICPTRETSYPLDPTDFDSYDSFQDALESIDYDLINETEPSRWVEDFSLAHPSKIAQLDIMYIIDERLPDTVEQEMLEATELANLIYENSKVHIRLNPVELVRATLPIPLNIWTSVTDGQITTHEISVEATEDQRYILEQALAKNVEGLGSLKYTSGADVVIYLPFEPSTSLGYCGNVQDKRRTGIGTLRQGVDDMEVIIIYSDRCRYWKYEHLITHEIGHTLGLGHGPGVVELGMAQSYPWAQGHGIQDRLNTIMAYPYLLNSLDNDYHIFSNPNLMCGDVPCGVNPPGNEYPAANAALAQNLVRFQAAALQKSQPSLIPIETAIEGIADPNLQRCIRNSQEQTITEYAGQIFELLCPDMGISNLDGLEVFENLRIFDLTDNPISDISPLQALPDLTSLRANCTGVNNISPLLQHKNIERLEFQYNESNIPCWQLDQAGKGSELRYFYPPEGCGTSEEELDYDLDNLSNRFELDNDSDPTISNNEPSIFQFKYTEYAIFENELQLNVVVTRGQGQLANTSVRVNTLSETATEVDDYTALDIVIQFDEYEREKSITLDLVNDLNVEDEETLSLQLSEPVNGSLGENTLARVTIYNAGQQAKYRALGGSPPVPAPVPEPVDTTDSIVQPSTNNNDTNNIDANNEGGGAYSFTGLMLLLLIVAKHLISAHFLKQKVPSGLMKNSREKIGAGLTFYSQAAMIRNSSSWCNGRGEMT